MFHTSRWNCTINRQSSDTPLYGQKSKFSNTNVETAALNVMSLIKSSLSRLSGTLSTIAKLILQKALSLTKHRADLYFDVYTSLVLKMESKEQEETLKAS